MILKGVDLKLSFGGLVAVNNVSFEIQEKTIFGIIGPNGAGKTTLFNIISGVYKPQSGSLYFKDKDITKLAPYKRARLGIARTHQVVKPLGELTVFENVMVGACFGKKNYNLKQAQKIALDVINFVGLSTKMFNLASQLNVAFKKRLELARALANEPEIILLDEVLAGLNPKEVDGMLDVILKIKQNGVTIIMIEHLMHAIMKVSDVIMVLDSGEKIAQGSPKEVSNNTKVIEAYLGDPSIIPTKSGSIIFKGTDISKLPAYERAQLGVIMVPEGRLLFGEMSVLENLQMGAYLKRTKDKYKQNLDFVFSLFPKLSQRINQKAQSLSGGEQQMVAIARGLMANPEILIFDEPSLGLSPKLTIEVFTIIKNLKEEGIAMLLVEQNAHLSLAISDSAYVLSEGRVVLEGAGKDLLEDESVKKAFLGI